MKKLSTILLAGMILAVGCAKESVTETPSQDGESAAAAEAVAAKTYALEGTIMSRDDAAKTLTIKHGAIGDWMDAMTMPFPVRGDFASLPADGSNIKATVHVAESGDYWITDVVETPAVEMMEGEPAEDESTEEPPTEESAEQGQEVSL